MSVALTLLHTSTSMTLSMLRGLRSFLFILSTILFQGTTAHADLLRLPLSSSPMHRASGGQVASRALPTFPESRLLEFRDRVESWARDSAAIAGKWRGDLEDTLREVVRSPHLETSSPCNIFLAQALKLLFGITDFDFPGLPGQFLDANDIAKYVSSHPEQWTFLGIASDQIVLERAATYANLNRPVIAVYVAAPHGHVAVVLPGTLQYSGHWKLHVPNSASVFLNRPSKSYVGLTLSNAFQAAHMPKVKLYARNSLS